MKFKELFLKTYRHIDKLPIYNWIKIHEEQNTKYVYITDEFDGLEETEKSQRAYSVLYEQFFNSFAITERLVEYLNAKKRMYIKLANAYINDDKSLLNFVQIEKRQIEDKYERGDTNIDYSTVLSELEFELKVQIDPHKMSVKSFFTHLKNLEARNKKINEQMKQWQRK